MAARRAWLIGGATVGGLVLALVVWVAVGGEDDPLEPLREHAAVTAVRTERNDLELRVRPDASPEAIAELAERLPEGRLDGRMRVGAVNVRFRRTADLRQLPPAISALARVEAPAERIEIRAGTPRPRVMAWVARREQAAPFAREAVERLSQDGVRGSGIDGLEVRIDDTPSGLPVVRLDASLAFSAGPVREVLAAASRVPELDPNVSVTRSTGELSVVAADVAAVGAAWDAAVAALRGPDDQRGAVRIAVAVASPGDQPGGRNVVLRGTADESPGRAVALLRVLARDSDRPYVQASLEYAAGRFPDAAAARTAAVAARARGVDGMEVRWSTATEQTAWLGGAGNAGRDETRINAEPATVVRLIPGVARARRAGIPALRWNERPSVGTPSLAVARPRWLDDGAAVGESAASLRRLARAIRAIDWPGAATFTVVLGPGSCSERPTAQSVAQFVSTSTGRARSVRGGAACTDAAAVRAARRAWNATAAER